MTNEKRLSIVTNALIVLTGLAATVYLFINAMLAPLT